MGLEVVGCLGGVPNEAGNIAEVPSLARAAIYQFFVTFLDCQ